jgi:formamidopyrimidine-DNA glycosylase
MPELPEVEVTRLSFADRIAGARIERVQMGKPLRWPLGCRPALLVGQQVLAVRRRGKYLLVDLSEGLLMIHLGMSGSVGFGSGFPAPGKHDHFEMATSLGTLRLNDPRRFGAVVYARDENTPTAQKLLGRLGVEPLSDAFDAAAFHQALKLRNTAIKQVLLGGEAVVGVGNIYASEALFLAGIRPTTRASKISKPRAALLHGAIRRVLAQAVTKGGALSGIFRMRRASRAISSWRRWCMTVRASLAGCVPAPVKSIRQGQRSTFYCMIARNLEPKLRTRANGSFRWAMLY